MGLNLLTGLAVPWGLWGGWMIFRLGFHGTMDFWKTYPSAVSSASGVAIYAHLNFLSQIFSKISGIREIFKARGILFLSFGLFALIWIAKRDRKWVVFCIFAWIHFIWWIFFTPKVQARYLMPTYVICILANIYLVSFLFQQTSFFVGTKIPKSIKVTLAAVIVASSLVPIFLNGSVRWENFHFCGLSRQLAIQKFWRAQENHPIVYTTEFTYGHDNDMVLTAPHTIVPVAELEIVEKSKNGWILVGEMATTSLVTRLQNSHCTPLFLAPSTDEGFWSCQENP